MRTNINPFIVQYLSSGQYDKLVILSRQAIKNTYKAISITGLLSICIFPMSFLLVKNNAEFVQSWPIFAILVFGIIFSAGYIPFSNILLLAGYPGQHSIMILIQVFLNICGNILLIPFMGGYGAAIATSFSNILLIFLVKKFSMKILKLKIR